MKKLCQMILKAFGWQIVGELPQTKKFVLIVAPHTSNWDLVIGLVAMFAVGGRFHFLAKHQVFFFPLGLLLKAMGGIPLDRSKHHNLVDQVVNHFNEHDAFVLGLAPEGTRSPVKRWKTGFYHIANKAKVPIAMVGFDFSLKQIILREAFWPTGDIEKDFKDILSFHRGIHGRVPKELPDYQPSKKHAD